MSSGEQPAFIRYSWFGRVDRAWAVQVPNYPFEHEVRVWLPPSYAYTEQTYPTLWVMDNGALEIAAAALTGCTLGDAPELILVSIGSPLETPGGEFQRRRIYDFTPSHN